MTHGIGFLPQCDQIIVMDGGRITESGAYAELIDADGDFAEFIRTFTAMDENEEGDPSRPAYMCILSIRKNDRFAMFLEYQPVLFSITFSCY